MDRLSRNSWEQAVAPHRQALKEAAQAHYQVINELRKEQQRLIDESDRIQRTIDQLEKEYQDMTTPQPENSGSDEIYITAGMTKSRSERNNDRGNDS